MSLALVVLQYYLLRLETLQPGGLPHPGGEDSPHTQYGGLAQLVRLASVVVDAPEQEQGRDDKKCYQ